MILTIKCLHCDGAGRVPFPLAQNITGEITIGADMVCPSCYGVATQRVHVSSVDDVDSRSIVSPRSYWGNANGCSACYVGRAHADCSQ